MKSFDLLLSAPYGDVKTVGIPRGFLYYRFGVLCKTFFEELGCRVVLSSETDRLTLKHGDALSVDECCLASKIFMGHVANLKGRCDAIFVPRYNRFGLCKSFCTKFQALPDLVESAFKNAENNTVLLGDTKKSAEEEPLDARAEACAETAAATSASPASATFANPRILSANVDEYEKTPEKEAFIALGMKMGHNAAQAKRAYNHARKAQDAYDAKLHQKLATDLRSPETDSTGAPKLKILVAAHPYVVHDPYVGKPLIDMLQQMEAIPLFADHYDRARAFKTSRSFSDTLPWLINRELIGAMLDLHNKIDGIVLVSAFPCGPDSMTTDAVMRYIKGRPILSITVDAQSGTAGLETRVESFVDILRYQKQGGYSHGE